MSLLIGFGYIIPLVTTTVTASYLCREFKYTILPLVITMVIVWDVCTAILWYGVLSTIIDNVYAFEIGILASFCVATIVRAIALLINKSHYDRQNGSSRESI